MARLQALATSLAVHAVAFAAVVLVPVLGNEPLPEANGHPPPPCTWPMSPTNPEYPDLAKRAGIRGKVVLECLIDASGRIADVRVLSGHPLLAPAAVNAVSRWLYTPTLLNGVAVPVLLTVTVRFNLGR